MLRYRQGGLISTYSDEKDDPRLEREYKYYAG